MSLVNPQTYPSKGKENTEEREEPKKIAEIEKDKKKSIVYQDEAHFQIGTTITRKWMKKGSKPGVGSPPGKKSVSCSGYIEPSTRKLHIGRSSWYNYSRVIESLRAFASSGVIEEGKKIVLILDNAP